MAMLQQLRQKEALFLKRNELVATCARGTNTTSKKISAKPLLGSREKLPQEKITQRLRFVLK